MSEKKKSIIEEFFAPKPTIPTIPLKDCRNCTYFRPLEGFYGFCNKLNENLTSNQAILCAFYMPFGQVTTQIDASFVVSGIFDLVRIPRVDLTKIPLGTNGYFLKGQGAADSVYAPLAAADIPSLDAAKITTGIFDLARIPTMDDAHIPNVETLGYGGAFADGQIPSLATSKITSGIFDVARIPDLSANKIVSEILAEARIPHTFINDLFTQARILVSGRDIDGWLWFFPDDDLEDGKAVLLVRKADNITETFRLQRNGKILYGSADASFITSGVLALVRIPNMDWAHISALFPRTVAEILSNSTFTSVVQATGYKNTSPSLSAPSRSLGTVYQNTTGKTIIVYLCAELAGSTSANANRVEAYLKSSSPPDTFIGEISNSSQIQTLTLTIIVPDQWYYKFGGIGTINAFWWNEQTL